MPQAQKQKPAQKSAQKSARKSTSGKTVAPKAKEKTRRWKAGTVALREIRRYQKSTDPIFAKAPFQRLVREICQDLPNKINHELRFQASALAALQEAAETMLVQEFEMTQIAAIHAKRVTIQVKDMKLVQSMRRAMTGFSFPGNMN
ncbi:hypothetical protein VE00_05105 [Pseudogymnoascus sp. WSF 3629]|nr:hypothetical protein VE00_05105 [Pseudogymnoascus sp. WSF 3629]